MPGLDANWLTDWLTDLQEHAEALADEETLRGRFRGARAEAAEHTSKPASSADARSRPTLAIRYGASAPGKFGEGGTYGRSG